MVDYCEKHDNERHGARVVFHGLFDLGFKSMRGIPCSGPRTGFFFLQIPFCLS
jgi:hypothetical protein